MRPSKRAPNQLREIQFQRNFTQHAEGSVLACYGDTKVICTASVTESVPRFLRGKEQGWITAEYGMLPRSTHSRCDREAARGKQGGRTMEIQRLIGRSLRTAVNLKLLPEITIALDCDVIQADGGTRTASISGSFIALQDAIHGLMKAGKLKRNPIVQQIASISVGIYKGEPILDLDYAEDSNAETDFNVVMNDKDEFIEVQGTAEEGLSFKLEQLDDMLVLAKGGIKTILELQSNA